MVVVVPRTPVPRWDRGTAIRVLDLTKCRWDSAFASHVVTKEGVEATVCRPKVCDDVMIYGAHVSTIYRWQHATASRVQ